MKSKGKGGAAVALGCELSEAALYEGLFDTIKSLCGMPRDQAAGLLEISEPRQLKAGEIFIPAGEVPKKLAFNLRGLFRYFYTDRDGQEFTKGFFPENTFISSYSAMIRKRESYFTVEAMEDAFVLAVAYEDWQLLLQSSPIWSSLLIAMLEMGYAHKEARERELLLFDAETRYRIFLAKSPQLEKRIKQHYIASFLGITPVALSRIRKKMGLVG